MSSPAKATAWDGRVVLVLYCCSSKSLGLESRGTATHRWAPSRDVDLAGDLALGRDPEDLPGPPDGDPKVARLVPGVAVGAGALPAAEEDALVGHAARLLVKV